MYPLTPETPLFNLADPFSPCSLHNEGSGKHGRLLSLLGSHDFDPAYPPHIGFSHPREHPHQGMHVTIQGDTSQMDNDNDDNDEDEDEEETLPLMAVDGEVQETVEVGNLCEVQQSTIKTI